MAFVVASKTRHTSISAGSVLLVRDQGNAERNAVLRRKYDSKNKGFKGEPLKPDQSKPLHSVSLLELIDTSTGIN